MKVASILCVVGLSLMSVPALATSSPDAPSLTDTLSWMDYTYNPRITSGSLGRGLKEFYDRSGSSNFFSRVTESFTYKDCQMVLHIQDDPDSSLSGIHQDVTHTFDLHNIDAKSIELHRFDSHDNGQECADLEVAKAMHMECDTAEINFSTRNKLPLISTETRMVEKAIKGSKEVMGPVDKTMNNTALFEVNNVDYAKRFARAFARAIELCSKQQ